ncbi:MAG: hypothetical protein SOT34_01930 [Candidatus Borkfalkiaceae bacterium]|nr:hypothetical protein [Christensenellaceae bacterium]
MKIKTFAAACLAVVLPLSACGRNATESVSSGGSEGGSHEEPKYRSVQLLQDQGFRKGFSLRGLNSATDSGVCKTIDYGNGANRPVWTLAQWWSKYNLKDGVETNENGVYSLRDESKSFVYDSVGQTVTLELDGSKEFDSVNLVPPTMWPHLLIEQSVEGLYWLKDADEVRASLKFTINRSENLRGGNQGCHAQFAWFIYVVDKNPDSDGYGNFLWFGLNLFDSTKIYTQGTAQQDTAGGPGNFIYSLGSQELFTQRVRVGESAEMDIDLKLYVAEALATAQSKGFMLNTEVDDCVITGTNLGWEVFDRFDVSVTIEKMGIEYRTFDESIMEGKI